MLNSVCKFPRIFERKVLLSVLNSKNVTFFHQIVSQNLRHKNLGFTETELSCNTVLFAMFFCSQLRKIFDFVPDKYVFLDRYG